MFYIIYKITNQINGKIYIGSHKTKNLDDNYMGSGKYLKRAIEKNGIDNFKKEILHVYDNPESMYAKEAELVNEDFLANENTYNMKVGGFGGWDYINDEKYNRYPRKDNIKVKESLRKATVVMHQKLKTDETFRKEISEKISNSLKKRYDNGMTPHFQGKTHTEETKNKLSKTQKSIDRSGDKNPSYGKMWITNGIDNKKQNKLETIPEGWRKGRVCK